MTEQKLDFNNLPPIFGELKELRNSLSKCDLDKAKIFIRDCLSDDVLILQEGFTECFKDIPQTDPLRLEVLQTLAELGIRIY
jgi:hypothetical protein